MFNNRLLRLADVPADDRVCSSSSIRSGVSFFVTIVLSSVELLSIASLICSITYNLDRAMCFRNKRGCNTAELKSFKRTVEPASSDKD